MTISTLQLMTNPINLQCRLLEHMESKLLGGAGVLVDPNSVCMHLIEGFTDISSEFAMATKIASERRLPTRAQTDNDLYLHMSDYDTIGSFATPSKATIVISFDKEEVLKNGVLENNSYRVLTIPKDTIFKLGSIPFSMYYPIRIQIDERTKIPLVTYDISEQHPLMSMQSNRVVFSEMQYMGHNLINLYITIYQFALTTQAAILEKDIGFTEVFSFSDQFYAIRLFTDYQGNRIELGQSMVQDNYDATRPTARIQVEPDINKFSINIPQIYFTLGYMGLKLYIELYTTKGKITANVGSLPAEQVKVNYNLSKKPPNPYTDPLKFSPTVMVNIQSPTTTEGSNGYTFEEKRQRVINGSYRTKAQITPMDLQNYYADYGIKVVRYEDNLTDLIYFVYKPFVDEINTVVPSTNSYLQILPDTPTKVSSIRQNVDSSITILPNTWYNFLTTQDLCIPLTDEEVNYLSTLDSQGLMLEFNSQNYVKTPFHMRLIQSHTYPTITTYNLMQPEITEVTITEDNPASLAQMLAIGESITHDKDGSGGYTLNLIVKKDFLDNVNEVDLVIWLSTTATDGSIIGIQAVRTGTVDAMALYQCHIDTDYWIDEKNQLNLTNVKDSSTELNHKVNLQSKFQIIYMCKQTYFPGVNTQLHMYNGVPDKVANGMCVLLRQSMIVNFGHSLDDVVFNYINPIWERQQYRRHPIDIYNTYSSDIFKTENGVPVITWVDGKPELEKIHAKGDIVIGGDGKPEIKHLAGSLWSDTNGQPVILKDRINEYQIMAPVFDGKLFISEHPRQKAFIANLIAQFESYFQIIREARGYVTERTNVYFRPSKTMGHATFSTGNGIEITLPLNLTFKFRLHVEPMVTTDKVTKESVRLASISVIEKVLKQSIISQTGMAKLIKDDVAYTQSVDALGICNITDLQTLELNDNSAQPSLRQSLIISEDNKLIMREEVNLEYVSSR